MIDRVRAASSAPASSTCTCTCASRARRRPRRSRPAAEPPRSAASPRSWRCRTPIRRRTASKWSTSSASRPPAPDCARCSPPRRSRSAGHGDPARPVRRTGRDRRAHLHRRRQRRAGSAAHAPGVRVRAAGSDITLAQHCEVARLTEGAVMHEGSCCSRLGLPGWPSIAEELMVHRDIELVRLTGRPSALPAPVDRRQRRTRPSRPRPMACR